MLAIGRTKAWMLVRDGTIPSIRMGRTVRVPTKALFDWLDGAGKSEAQN